MELVDMQNLKFCAQVACGFKSRPAHQQKTENPAPLQGL